MFTSRSAARTARRTHKRSSRGSYRLELKARSGCARQLVSRVSQSHVTQPNGTRKLSSFARTATNHSPSIARAVTRTSTAQEAAIMLRPRLTLLAQRPPACFRRTFQDVQRRTATESPARTRDAQALGAGGRSASVQSKGTLHSPKAAAR
jgi:hypothetical protein